MKLIQKLAVAFIRTRFRILSLFSKQKAAEYAFGIFCTPQSRTIKELPTVFLEAEQLQFSFDDYSITGYRWNKGGIRKVLIVHGFESSVVNFDHYIQPLVAKGYEVLAFDAPAHGRSSGRRITAYIYRDFIRHIYQEYGPIDSFIAHSFGGLALSLALAEIPHDEGLRMVLIAPATETRTAFEQFYRLMPVKDPAVREHMENIVVRLSGHPVSWFSIPRTLTQIRASVLWVHDKKDLITPYADMKALPEKNYPNVRFVITEGLGHRRIYRDAAISSTIINFL